MADTQKALPEEKWNPDVLKAVVQRIVAAVRPVRIVLFGSAARGTMGSHSDIDLLVVMPDGVHRRRTAHRIYRALLGVGFATDITVVTESDVKQYGEEHSLVICPALREGKELYRAV